MNLVGGEGDRLDEEILLGGEVAIDGRAGDVDGLADVVDARGRVAVTVENSTAASRISSRRLAGRRVGASVAVASVARMVANVNSDAP